MTIPKRFQLMGLTINVTLCDTGENDNGNWSLNEQQIRIDKSLKEEMQLQTFWHEAVHACLQVLSYDELGDDEAFVDRLAFCLAQIDRTRKQ